MDQDFLKKLTDITEANIGNPQFGVDELAREMGMSRSSLFRKLHASTQKPVSQFIREIRLWKALELMQEGGYTASEVSYKTGFSSPAYFNNCFHEYFGYPPGEARKVVMDVKEVKEVKSENKEGRERGLKWKKRSGRIIFGISAGIVLVFFYFISTSIINNAHLEKTIAVLPFRNLSNDSTNLSFCYGFKQVLLNNLAEIQNLKVMAAISTEQYLNTKKTPQTIGKEVNAEYLIDGTIGFDGNSFTVGFQLIKARTNQVIGWKDNITHEMNMKEIYASQSELAREIAAGLNTKLSTEGIAKIEVVPTENVEAFKYYQKGLYYTDFSHAVDMQLAEKWFRKAIELDSLFVKAYLGLANTLTWMYQGDEDRRREVLEESIRTIEKVIEIDSNMPEAYMALGRNYMADENYGKAQKQFERSLALRPNSPTATGYMGTTNMYLGHWDEAMIYLRKYFELKPKDVQINLRLGMTYEYLRDFPRAIPYYDQIVGINPVFSLAYNQLSDITLKWKGDTGKARKILEDMEHDNPPDEQTIMYFTYRYVWMDLYEGRYEKIPGELSRCPLDVFPADYFYQPKYLLYAMAYGFMNKPDLERVYYDSTRVFLEQLQKSKPEYQDDARVINSLGLVYAGLGQPEQAIKLGEESVKLVPATKNALRWPYLAENLAYIYTRAGKYPEALKLLNELLSKPGPLTTKLLEMDPRWTPLRNLPEFKKILKAYSIK